MTSGRGVTEPADLGGNHQEQLPEVTDRLVQVVGRRPVLASRGRSLPPGAGSC